MNFHDFLVLLLHASYFLDGFWYEAYSAGRVMQSHEMVLFAGIGVGVPDLYMFSESFYGKRCYGCWWILRIELLVFILLKWLPYDTVARYDCPFREIIERISRITPNFFKLEVGA